MELVTDGYYRILPIVELTAKESLQDHIHFLGYAEYDTHKVERINPFTRVFAKQ
jgi:hypothetical protein